MLSGFPKRLSSWLAIALGCLLLNSCVETEQEFTLNPDGTGKMVLNTVFPNIQLNGDEDPTDEALQDAVASTPYNNGVFRPDIRGNSVLAYVTARGEDCRFGRNLGTEISAPPLKDFMLMGYSSFSGDQANRNYALGLLLTHYFSTWKGVARLGELRNSSKVCMPETKERWLSLLCSTAVISRNWKKTSRPRGAEKASRSGSAGENL